MHCEHGGALGSVINEAGAWDCIYEWSHDSGLATINVLKVRRKLYIVACTTKIIMIIKHTSL